MTPKRPDRPQFQAWLERLSKKAGGRDPASVVIENLGEVARRLFTEVSPGGLVLTGGETAGRVFQELHADGARIHEEIDAGIGRAVVAGGPHDGMGLVIKPGSFGDENTLAKAVECLSPRAVDTKAGDSEAGDAQVGTTGPVSERATGNLKGTGMDERPVIGITLGDPNGVGPEIIVKILSQKWVFALCRPLVIGHDEVLRQALSLAPPVEDDAPGGRVGGETAPTLDINVISQPAAGQYRYGTVDVLNPAGVEIGRLKPGQEQAEAGRLAVESVKRAARMAMAGDIAALVTAPMNKAAMGLAGYAYAGHTELLAEITGTKRFRLALAFDGMLVSHATTHVSLRDAIDRLSEEEILDTLDLVGNALAGMGMAAPRIAVCGLNPHAGEGGLFGDEEIPYHRARHRKSTREIRRTGLADHGSPAAGPRVHASPEGRLRRDHRHVSRPGAHPGQGDRL